MSPQQISTLPASTLQDEDIFGNIWEEVKKKGSELIGTAEEAGVKRANEEVTNLISGTNPPTPATSTPKITPPPTASTPTQTTQPPAVQLPPETEVKTVESEGIISKVKSIPPWGFGALIGIGTYVLSKSPIGAAIGGAIGYVLTDKYMKK